jgi:site-specific recombinase XerD
LLNQENKLKLLKRPKKVKDLPNVFSKQEIERLLGNIQNLKHKTLLTLAYSSGLRKSEVKNLLKNDILFDRNSIFIRCSKGKKDRYVILADKAAEFLKSYLTQYNPKYWLFEGQYGGQYSETSIQSIFVQAKQKATVNPNVTLHSLRHSFATHLVENNVPLHIVKDLLGHQSLKTTQVYLHISDKMRKNIQSPLDGLNI